MFPSPLKLPPDTVADAPLKLIVGSCFTVTAASAVAVMTAAATSTATTTSHLDFFISLSLSMIKQRGGPIGEFVGRGRERVEVTPSHETPLRHAAHPPRMSPLTADTSRYASTQPPTTGVCSNRVVRSAYGDRPNAIAVLKPCCLAASPDHLLEPGAALAERLLRIPWRGSAVPYTSDWDEFHGAARRLRQLLFGDEVDMPGKLKGEDARAQAKRDLRRMRDAFDAVVARSEEGRTEKADVEARVADLQEELKRIAASRAGAARAATPAPNQLKSGGRARASKTRTATSKTRPRSPKRKRKA